MCEVDRSHEIRPAQKLMTIQVGKPNLPCAWQLRCHMLKKFLELCIERIVMCAANCGDGPCTLHGLPTSQAHRRI